MNLEKRSKPKSMVCLSEHKYSSIVRLADIALFPILALAAQLFGPGSYSVRSDPEPSKVRLLGPVTKYRLVLSVHKVGQNELEIDSTKDEKGSISNEVYAFHEDELMIPHLLELKARYQRMLREREGEKPGSQAAASSSP